MEEKKVWWYDRIEMFLIILLFSIMTVILFVNVVTRFCFSYTATWTEQAARILFVWMTFAGVSLAGKTSAHLQVTVINMAVGEKRARIAFWIGDIIVVVFSLFLAYKIFGVMSMVMKTKQVFPAIPWLPSWTLYFPGVAGLLGFAARIVQRRVRGIRAAGAGQNEEVRQ